MEISAELLAAREKHLEDCIEAKEWNPPFKKPRFDAKPALPAPLPPPLPAIRTIDIDAEAAYVEELRQVWQREKQALDKTVADCAAAHETPAPNYWEKAHRAHARYALAKHVFAMLTA